MYENWLLAAGFQSLMRGVRETLEVAAVHLELLLRPPHIPWSATLKDIVDSIREQIAKLPFPDLLTKVNMSLATPIQFKNEFLSTQKVRNCLEHRMGVVRKHDLDPGGSVLTLSFPHIKVFYMRDNKEVELEPDVPVQGNGEPEVQILVRVEAFSRTYALGERVTFTGIEFGKIALACSLFGSELADKLPAVGQI
jgi:hypothetical protein